MAGTSATNEPKHAAYGAPDFVIQHGNVPIGHAEAKDVGLNLDKVIADSEREVPRTREGEQLKRYRAALPNLLYTDGLEWHWFVNGEPRLDAPVSLGTWSKASKKLKPAAGAAEAIRTLLAQFKAQQVQTSWLSVNMEPGTNGLSSFCGVSQSNLTTQSAAQSNSRIFRTPGASR
jgi:hypothetical protein